MRLYIERDAASWNKMVEVSPYAVSHHKYEVLKFGGHALPLVFEKGENRLLFPFVLKGFLGLRLATVPFMNLASVLPITTKDISVIPEALDVVLNYLDDMHVDLLRMGAPYLLPKEYFHLLDKWFKQKEVLAQTIFADVLDTRGKSFKHIWEKAYSKHARNRARKAEKEGVVVREVSELDKWISDIQSCNMSSFHRTKRYPRYPHSDKEAFLVYLNRHRQLLHEGFKVYGAFFRNRLIAYIATVESNKLIILMLALSRSEFLPKCPSNALLKYIISYACKDNFSWINYSFDRVPYDPDRPTLLSSLRRFKFEHGFEERPMNIYSLGLTYSGRLLQRLMVVYNNLFIFSERLPIFITDALQQLYERQKFRKSRYKYVKDELQRTTVDDLRAPW